MLRWTVYLYVFFFQPAFPQDHKKLLDSPPAPEGGFSTRNTFIYGFSAPVFSIRLGARFMEKFSMGAAFCFLKNASLPGTDNHYPFAYRKPVVNESGQMDTIPSYLKLIYFAYYADYIYYSRNRWQFSIPLRLGFGQSHYEYTADGFKKRELESPVLLYEPSVSVQYRLLKWLAAGAEVGYRFMLVDRKAVGNGFNSPVYDLKLMVLWRELAEGAGIMGKKDK